VRELTFSFVLEQREAPCAAHAGRWWRVRHSEMLLCTLSLSDAQTDAVSSALKPGNGMSRLRGGRVVRLGSNSLSSWWNVRKGSAMNC